jgi:hypothetical protein
MHWHNLGKVCTCFAINARYNSNLLKKGQYLLILGDIDVPSRSTRSDELN